MRNQATCLSAALMAIISLVLVGCATAPSGNSTKSQSELLTQAGFRAHTARSPQQLTYVQTLPAQKVVLNQYEDKPLYLVCTDPDSQQCFLGDRTAYDRYQQLAIRECIASSQCKVSEHRWDPEALTMWMDSQGGG
jgi:hypothetical protein